MKVFFMPLSPACNGLERLLPLVSPERRERAARCRLPEDKKQTVFSEALVRVLLCRETGLDNARLCFSYGEHGKPRLAGCAQAEFSLSHTSGAVAVALSERAVGVDVERIKPLSVRVASRFDQRECAYIFGREEGADERFFRVWTRKEAYGKRSGEGLRPPFSSPCVMEGELSELFKTFVFGAYVLSVCGEGAPAATAEILSEDFVLRAPLAPFSDAD